MAPPVTAGMLVVFALVVATIVLFVTEVVSPDTTALAVIVALAVLEPWTQMTPTAAISGLANPATVTILAMFVLSAGVQETGLVQVLGAKVARVTRGDPDSVLGATVGLTGPIAGFVNNTPVVAVFIPMITDLADESYVSPSKLLMPLSYAAMLGGTLTLVGTSTNLVASDLSRELLDHPFSMFEFTHLGAVVLSFGVIYLVTVGQWLLPERIHPADLIEEFGLGDHVTRVYVRGSSPLVGLPVAAAMAERDVPVDVVQIVRGDETFLAAGSEREIRAGDVLTVRGSREQLDAFVAADSLRRLPAAGVTEQELSQQSGGGTVVEAVLPASSPLVGESVGSAKLRAVYGATVLAIRQGSDVHREDLTTVSLAEGDALLIHASTSAIQALEETGVILVSESAVGYQSHLDEPPMLDRSEAGLAVGIVGAVIAVAALGLSPIVIAALGGVVAMLVTDLLDPADAYDAVSWDVIFLLAGVIPLGIALQETGGAALLASLIVEQADLLPPLAVLALFYVLTGLLANVITPVASVVLLLPIAVSTATRIGAEPFAFVLGVTFAASTAFMTPVGYQTNLMVYSPGGYRFTDYVRVGAPLQLLLSVVTPVFIWLFWGL
ncbi:SLC13 family permease [Halorientalis brevis]|uniref:SLC13 family permease n=1 Tax=Halorientalis brevis TaxID=1126241 RepID=A0ABD6CED3_9EURY|nr:SLC13 family permease [Halorientalis brevis]